MKSRIFCALIAAVLCPLLSATTTVSGSIKTLGGTSANNSFVRFWLRGCNGNQPRVNGVAIMPSNTNGQFYFDFPSSSTGTITGSLYSTRDAAGTGSGEIDCGGSHTAAWYGMQVYRNSVGGPETPVHAKNTGTLDVSNVTPTNTNPVVVAPTGDSVYARLDAGNQPFTGNITPSGSGTLNLGSSSNRWNGFFNTLDITGGLNFSHAGVFTDTQCNFYVLSQIGNTTLCSAWGGAHPTDAVSGIVTAPVGATDHQFNGGDFYCYTNAVSSPLGSMANCVGIFGVAHTLANNTAAWGANFISYDAVGQTGTLLVGNEIDLGLFGTPTRYQGFFITGNAMTGTMPSGPVMGTLNVASASASAFGVAFPGTTGTNPQFPVAYWSARGTAPVGLMLDASCYTGACASQSIKLGSNTGSAALTATIQEDTAGNIVQTAGVTGFGVKPPQATFAQLGAASNGTIVYCTDCKNIPDNAAVAGAACANGGNGTVARRDNSRWDCN